MKSEINRFLSIFGILSMLLACLLLGACLRSSTLELTYQVGYMGSDNMVWLKLASSDGASSQYLFPQSERNAVAVWSPDGSKVITYGYEDSPFPFEYYIYDTDGGRPICLTCGLDEYGTPNWSPSGEQIAIRTENALVLSDTEGSIIEEVKLEVAPFNVSWSPDSQALVFTIEANKGALIYRVNADGTNLVNLSERIGSQPGRAFGAQWSPVEDMIAYHSSEGGLHIALMNKDGGDRRKLISWETTAETLDPATEWPPQWSPDGKKIAFTSVSSFGDLDIFVINLDGTDLTNLTNQPGIDCNPVWSPNGQMIAFVSTRDGDQEVYVMAADGSNQINISNDPGVPDINPTWRLKPSK
jgi:Tol biopolymer transport system component